MALQIGRGCHNHAFIVGEAGTDDARVFQFANPDCAVISFFDEIDETVAQIETDTDVRVSLGESGQERGNVSAPETGGGADSQVSGRPYAALRYSGFDIVEFS